jgi:basic membrane protein A and related proteins
MFKKIISILLLSVMLVPLFQVPVYAGNDKTITFLMADSQTDSGWNFAHWRGIEYLKTMGKVISDDPQGFKVDTGKGILTVRMIQNIGYNPADIDRIAREMVNTSDLMVGTWFDSKDAMATLAEEYPDKYFVHDSGYPFVKSNGKNFSTYFIRIENSDAVMGYGLGLQGINKVGIVGTHQIPEPVRGINGFALGLQAGLRAAGKPDNIDVNVVWIKSWLDSVKESEATNALIAEGYKVIKQLADTPTTSSTACSNGAMPIGYGSDVSAYAPCAWGTNEWSWGAYYKGLAENLMNNKFVSEDKWDDSYLFIYQNISADVKNKMMNFDGASVWNGPISGYGQDGAKIEVPAGKSLSDMDLLTMQFFVDGIRGELPPKPANGYELELK